MAFTLHQVYERVPLHGQAAELLVIDGEYACPDGHDANVPIEVRITSPAVAVTSWNGNTGAGFPSFVPTGTVHCELPAWSPQMCGQIITLEVRGFCKGVFTPWETHQAMVGPRSDAGRTWKRKVDGDLHVPPGPYQPARRWYPATLSELLWCVRHHHETAGPTAEARASGSHWALSYAAVTPGPMFETATPVHEHDGDQTAGRLNNVLYDVFPGCLASESRRFFEYAQKVHAFDPAIPADETQNYLFHVEAGMRIHELYAYIDGDADGKEGRSLAAILEREYGASQKPFPQDVPCYLGPWALETMGGAGGQTIAGTASTATHGADVKSADIGELVLAVHLVAPDGQEYWIERKRLRPGAPDLKLFDEHKLRAVYRVGDATAPGGTQRKRPLIYRRDDNLMNAALVSCGRMGFIYSVVLRTVRQYGLKQVTRKDAWKEVKKWIANPAHPTNVAVFKDNRFVRVDVEMYPQPELDWGTAAWTFGGLAVLGPIGLAAGLLVGLKGDEYRTWHLTRTKVPLQDTTRTDENGAPYYFGRKERGGANAGKGPNLEVDMEKGCFSKPCRSANFMRQFLTDTIGILSDIRDTAIEAAAVAFAAMAIPFATPLAAMAYRIALSVIVFTEYWILVLAGVRELLPATANFGDYVCAVLNALSAMHAHSIVQVLYGEAQSSEHLSTDDPLTAISYGVMDEHDYINRGCVAPGDSIELFFDATKPDFVGFVDYLLAEVRALADDGKGWGGYVSLRFMAKSHSSLAMQRWPVTVSMEIATLSKASGAATLMARIEEESLSRGAILHWGQRNNRGQADIEKHIFMDPWRAALSEVSAHGRLANFSTEFSRHKGLEITVPKVYALTALLEEGCEHEMTRVYYDGFDNPPGTRLELVHWFDAGGGVTIPLPDLVGDVVIPFGRGRSTIELRATRELNGEKYPATPIARQLRGFATGDFFDFVLPTESRVIGGVVRWYAEINLKSPRISDALRVSEVQLSATSGSDWVLHNAATGDVSFPGLTSAQPLPSVTVFNTNWRFHTAGAAQGAVPPVLAVRFRIVC
jgi:hypothetical protein